MSVPGIAYGARAYPYDGTVRALAFPAPSSLPPGAPYPMSVPDIAASLLCQYRTSGSTCSRYAVSVPDIAQHLYSLCYVSTGHWVGDL
eukprot:1151621-Rhodomonas_salina.2